MLAAARRRAAAAAAAQARRTYNTYHAPSPPPGGGGYYGSVNWYAIARCESGGLWSLNTGNGFWGGLQFTPGTWFANGGGPFSGRGPFPYSAAQQIAVAERVLASQGFGAWPYCGRFG